VASRDLDLVAVIHTLSSHQLSRAATAKPLDGETFTLRRSANPTVMLAA